MSTYTPPVRDAQFVLTRLLGGAGLDDDLIEALLGEAGRFAAEVVAPLNVPSDLNGCKRAPDGTVTTPPGFPEAYRQYAEAGWGTLALPEEHGGQGLPHVVATVTEEFLNSACHAFYMYPGLTHGAVAVLGSRASDELKAAYLPKLVSGEWLGTMALTEPQAGTDLGLIRTKAEPRGDGSYAISGEKIFCSGGEQDLTDNIVHLVLARLVGAPEGSRGISLFLVPKVLPDGSRNSVTCGAVEHKMGLRGSATCAMHFDGASGWLIGEENAGLAAMFIMMNAARLSCGAQGVAQAELAYQKASAYALERKQGRSPVRSGGAPASADPLIAHPDVRRLLMDARAFTEGFRALVLWTAWQLDQGEEELVSLLTPVLKAYGTDRGFETAVAMQQIFGGHGYITETGIEQVVRDARAAMLYEGANGVQALDLVGRKVAKDDGQALERFIALIEDECEAADAALHFLSAPLREAVHEARESALWLISAGKSDPAELGAGSYAFLQLIGVLSVGWMWLRLAKAALPDAEADSFCAAKLVTARYYALHVLPQVPMLRRKVEAGVNVLTDIPAEAFATA
jgi:alkylation response protein AidB-like acyl-CoA dehydrogenase